MYLYQVLVLMWKFVERLPLNWRPNTYCSSLGIKLESLFGSHISIGVFSSVVHKSECKAPAPAMEPSVARLHSVGATAFAHCTHPRKAAPGNTYSLQLFFILFCMVQCGSVVVLRLQKKVLWHYNSTIQLVSNQYMRVDCVCFYWPVCQQQRGIGKNVAAKISRYTYLPSVGHVTFPKAASPLDAVLAFQDVVGRPKTTLCLGLGLQSNTKENKKAVPQV